MSFFNSSYYISIKNFNQLFLIICIFSYYLSGIGVPFVLIQNKRYPLDLYYKTLLETSCLKYWYYFDFPSIQSDSYWNKTLHCSVILFFDKGTICPTVTVPKNSFYPGISVPARTSLLYFSVPKWKHMPACLYLGPK